MSQKFENLSALIDGENPQFDLQGNDTITAMKHDKELQQKWHSYHVIRYGLRKELPSQLNFDIAANVALALESEPAILAPKKTWRDTRLASSVFHLLNKAAKWLLQHRLLWR
jgi:sigma-E factor negative regulatory protein RseA